MNPLVSIILPVYNGEEFLSNAIESVLNQTYSNIELIIVNDGSTDRTEQIVKLYSDLRIRYFYQNNAGAGAARNFGMSVAKGEGICFIDADDVYHPEKVMKQFEYLQKNIGCGLVFNDICFIDKDNNIIGEMKPDIVLANKEDYRAYTLYRQSIPAIASIMIRKEIVDKGYRQDEERAFGEDVRFVFDIAKEYNFGYINEKLYSYRKHKNNITNNRKQAMQEASKWVCSFSDDEIDKLVSASKFTEIDKQILKCNIYIQMDRYRVALENLEDKFLFTDDAQNISICFLKGVCLYCLSEYSKAKLEFERVLKLDIGKAEAYNNLALCEYKLGNLPEAIKYLEVAMDKRKNYMDAALNYENLTKKVWDTKLTKCELMKDLLVFKKE